MHPDKPDAIKNGLLAGRFCFIYPAISYATELYCDYQPLFVEYGTIRTIIN